MVLKQETVWKQCHSNAGCGAVAFHIFENDPVLEGF